MSLIALSRIPVVAEEAVAGSPLESSSATMLTCPVELQEKTFWCWAAVGVSLARYYAQPVLRQCELARRMMGGDCCGSKNCDQVQRLDDVLGELGVELLATPHARALSFDEVVAEITAGRPVALRIELSGGGGHFVVINGVNASARVVYLGDPDPAFGPREPTYDELRTSYRGQWTDSYVLRDHAD